MSMRMNAFHDIVNSYSKPGMGVNGMPPGGCGQPQGCSDAAMMVSAFLNIGGQIAMAALQANNGAAQAQNQQASHSNAAINKAMEGAQDALVQLPKNSADYAKLQNQIDDLQAKIDAANNKEDAVKAQQQHESSFSGATINGVSLQNVASNITKGNNDIATLKNASTELGQLLENKKMNESIVETFRSSQSTVNFSSYAGSVTLDINGSKDQAVAHVKSCESKYVAADGTKLTAMFNADMAVAKMADEQLAQAQNANKNSASIEQKMTTQLQEATKVVQNSPFATQLGNEGITSIDGLNNKISKLEQLVAEAGKQQITGSDGQVMTDDKGNPITVDQYIKDGARLEAEIAKSDEALKTEGGVEGLQQKKTALEKQLEDKAKPQLEKLSTSYGKLNNILADFAKVAKEKADIGSAKSQLESLKDTQNEDRKFFQKMFGTGLETSEKSDRKILKGQIDAEKQEASAAEKAFVDEYGARPTENFKKQVVEQMTFIKNTVKQAGLEELAKKLGFNFD